MWLTLCNELINYNKLFVGFTFPACSYSLFFLCWQMQGVVNFFGRISILIDQNTQAFHLFMTALLQVFPLNLSVYLMSKYRISCHLFWLPNFIINQTFKILTGSYDAETALVASGALTFYHILVVICSQAPFFKTLWHGFHGTLFPVSGISAKLHCFVMWFSTAFWSLWYVVRRTR